MRGMIKYDGTHLHNRSDSAEGWKLSKRIGRAFNRSGFMDYSWAIETPYSLHSAADIAPFADYL